MSPVRVGQIKSIRSAMGDKKYIAIIESPEGDDRRQHFDKKINKVVDLEPLKNAIPLNNGIAPVNYGFIVGTYNNVDEEKIDTLVISKDKLKIGQQIEINPIALMPRKDGDDKILAGDSTVVEKYKEWNDVPQKQRDLIKNFFSYHYKFYAIKSS